MTRHRKTGTRASSEGFILVTVLWMLGALAALVSVYTAYISNSAMAAAVRDDTVLADGLFTAGLELAALQLVEVAEDERPLQGQVSFELGGATVTASFRNEAARIDLNTAGPELLAGLFKALGAENEAARSYAARILAWRASDAGPEGDKEAELYRAAGLGYGPRRGAFVHTDELWRVAGLPADLVTAALPHLTIYSGAPEPSAILADPLVLAALDLATARTQQVPATAPAAVPPQASDAVRVTIDVRPRDGAARRAEAVILIRDFGEDPYRVLAWRDGMNHQASLQAERVR
jgi:general secretion pathway protein K